MKIKLEFYPGFNEDMTQISRWLGRKIKDRLQGRPYFMDQQDFQDLSRMIRLGNWMIRAGACLFFTMARWTCAWTRLRN